MFKIILLIAIVAFVIYLTNYNKFKRLENAMDEAFSVMDIHMQKRFDLIPNLLATVKGYAKYEAETLEKVVSLRNSAVTLEDKAAAEGEIGKAVRGLLAVAESYPELKADSQFLNLQQTLSKEEDDIANARKYFNATVKEYNDAISVMPGALIANSMGLSKRPMWTIDDDEARKNVKVEF